MYRVGVLPGGGGGGGGGQEESPPGIFQSEIPSGVFSCPL